MSAARQYPASPMPLFPSAPHPQRRQFPGFARGDVVSWLALDGKTPGARLRGTVMNTLPRLNLIIIKNEAGDRTLEMQPRDLINETRRMKP
jgi:hypothetical protein